MPENQPYLPKGVKGGVTGGGGTGDTMRRFLEEFKGSRRKIPTRLQQASPFIASGLFGGDAYDYLSNWEGRQTPMQQFGGQAGQIGRQARTNLESRQNQLSLLGLGRSAAQAQLANQATGQAYNQQAQAFTNLMAQQSEMEALFAQQSFDTDMRIVQLILSSIGGEGSKNEGPGVGGAVGTIGGGLVGAYFGGPAGAGAGASIGGALGSMF